MKQPLTSFQPKSKTLWNALVYLSKRLYFSLFFFPALIFLLTGTSTLNAHDLCKENQEWWEKGFKKDKEEGYLALNNGVLNGDTVHLNSCQVPRGATASDLKFYRDIKDKECYTHRGIYYPNRPLYGILNPKPCYKIKTFCYKVDIGDDADTGVYQLWKYEYIVEDIHCGRTYKKVYYEAMYDHGAPTFHNFPNDTTIASAADMPPVDENVKIIDLCQYVAWWNVETNAVVDSASGNTYYLRTWSAGDPTGNESSRSQKIWIDGDDSEAEPDSSSGLVNQTSRKSETWKVYPNPANESIRINVYTDRTLSYQLYDGVGRFVKKGIYHRGQQISINSLDPGMYYIQLSDQSELLGVKKIMVVE